MRLLEGVALLALDRVDEAVRAFSDALTAADALLALADSNVAALQARALALSGLAVATGDQARASEAVEAFARVASRHQRRRGGRRHPPAARCDRRPRPGRCPRRGPRRAGPVMDTTQQSAQLTEAWARQRIWSQTANRLKQRIDRARLAALLLGIATAVLAVAVSQIGGVGCCV